MFASGIAAVSGSLDQVATYKRDPIDTKDLVLVVFPEDYDFYTSTNTFPDASASCRAQVCSFVDFPKSFGFFFFSHCLFLSPRPSSFISSNSLDVSSITFSI